MPSVPKQSPKEPPNRNGFSVVPVAIGLILGELVETNLKQSLVIFDGNWLLFLTRPIALLFFVLTALGLALPVVFDRIASRRLRASGIMTDGGTS